MAADGTTPIPRMVFVNSMSDLLHEDIPVAFRDQVFQAMEGAPNTIFQVLTKRDQGLFEYAGARYAGRGVPLNIWLGCSVENNRVAGRVDTLRRLKDRVGDFTAFLSVEPLLEVADTHDYRGIDWVLIGGESGHKARPMPTAAPTMARDLARSAGAAIWMKQFGTWPNNPLYRADAGATHLERVRAAIDDGERLAWIANDPKTGRPRIEGEKGGATLRGEILHELPPSWHSLKASLVRTLL